MKAKIKFSDIAGMLERDEMREITGGCGSYACGGMYGVPNIYSGPGSGSSSILSGFGGGTAIGSTFGGQTYSGYNNSTINNFNSGPQTGVVGYTTSNPAEIKQIVSNYINGKSFSYNPSVTYDLNGGHLGGLTIFYGAPKPVSDISKPLGAFQLGWDTTNILTAAAFEGTAKLTAAEAQYLKAIAGIGNLANAAAAGITAYDAVKNGLKSHHVADLFVQTVIFDVALAVPVAGWIVGGAYFVSDQYFRSTHNGKSITEFYLD
jgi:hypothetical protein